MHPSVDLLKNHRLNQSGLKPQIAIHCFSADSIVNDAERQALLAHLAIELGAPGHVSCLMLQEGSDPKGIDPTATGGIVDMISGDNRPQVIVEQPCYVVTSTCQLNLQANIRWRRRP